MSAIEEVMQQIKNSNSVGFSGFVILDKYHKRIPRKEKKKIKKQFSI